MFIGIFLNEEEGKCLTECPLGKFKDLSTGKCELCSENCKGCSNKAEECSSCFENFFLRAEENKCVEECSKDETFNLARECIKCDLNSEYYKIFGECYQCSGENGECPEPFEYFMKNNEEEFNIEKGELELEIIPDLLSLISIEEIKSINFKEIFQLFYQEKDQKVMNKISDFKVEIEIENNEVEIEIKIEKTSISSTADTLIITTISKPQIFPLKNTEISQENQRKNTKFIFLQEKKILLKSTGKKIWIQLNL